MKKKKPGRPAIPENEKLALRALKIVGHAHAITTDEYGRDRVAQIASSNLAYDVGGHETIVRVRRQDPLTSISTLTIAQRKAGQKYRDLYETLNKGGIKPQSFEAGVDFSRGAASAPPIAIASAADSLLWANGVLGYPQMVRVVELACGLGMSFKAIARAERCEASRYGIMYDDVLESVARDALPVLLSMALDKLAKAYGMT